jgi:glycosyltransferase involved in cell wall biosynthesis
MFELFKSTDAVVLPYRKSYCCLSSGVLINSVQAFKPVIVPDIYPFNEIIKKYKIGLKFKVEDVKNLAKSINYLHKLIQEKKFKNENFKKYLDEMNSSDLVIAKLNI